MKYGNIVIKEKDFVYLNNIIKNIEFYKNKETRNSLKRLELELKTAVVVDEEEMPEDVICFNSIISVLVDKKIKIEIQLVKPEFKDLNAGKISILTPMGSALIGYAQNDTVFWKFPNKLRKVRILKVKQLRNKGKRIFVTKIR